jgi:trehalose-6-phosphate synthase
MATDERARRAQAIRGHVHAHDIEEWVEAQLSNLSTLPA